MDDAGSELDVVSLDRMAALDIPWKSEGPITLRQVAGPPISAELISLPIRVANPELGGVKNTEYVTIRAAGCRQMTHDIILCAPTVQLLIDRYNTASVMNDEKARASVSAVITRGQAARVKPPQASEPGDSGYSADDVQCRDLPRRGTSHRL